jgi:hypothetical protein
MIEYTYTVVEADEQGTVLRYESPGREPILRGVITPTELESLDNIARQYAPLAEWLTADAKRVVPTVGTVGVVAPPAAEVDSRTPLQIAKDTKRADIADWRYAQEVKGITVNGAKILTDRETQATISSALITLREGILGVIEWKSASGDFVNISINEITVIAGAVARHVQACFSAEARLVAEVNAATTVEQVEAVVIPAEVISGVV